MIGAPQIWAGRVTDVLPASIRACASGRWTLREVASFSFIWKLRLIKPASVNGIPILPATTVLAPSPLLYSPCLIVKLPPSDESSKIKLITPATASEPYCAAAPSRRISTRLRAILGITEISGPCEPSLTPPPWKAITDARWRRLPLTMTNVLSEDRPRKLAGRIILAASLIGCKWTFNEGTALWSCIRRSLLPALPSSSALITSTGTGESPTERGAPRDPITTTSSSVASAAVATVGSAMPPAMIAAAIVFIFQILTVFIILP